MNFDDIDDDEVGYFGFPSLASKTNSKKRGDKTRARCNDRGNGAIAKRRRSFSGGCENAAAQAGLESNTKNITQRCNGAAISDFVSGKSTAGEEGIGGRSGDKFKSRRPSYMTTGIRSVDRVNGNCIMYDMNKADNSSNKTKHSIHHFCSAFEENEDDNHGNDGLQLAHLLVTSKSSYNDEYNEAVTVPSKQIQPVKNDVLHSSSNSFYSRGTISVSESKSIAITNTTSTQSKSTKPQTSMSSNNQKTSQTGIQSTSMPKKKRQMGLQSFFTKPATTSRGIKIPHVSSSETNNATANSTNSTTSEDFISSRKTQTASYKRQYSFISAAEVLDHPMTQLGGGNLEKVEATSADSDDIIQQQNPNNASSQKEVTRNDDYLEEYNSDVNDDVDSMNTVVGKIDDKNPKHSNGSKADGPINDKETTEEVLSIQKAKRRDLRRKARRSQNEKVFGIHAIVFGYSYPSQIGSESSTFKSRNDSETQQQQQHKTSEMSSEKPSTLDNFLTPRQKNRPNTRYHSYNLLHGRSGVNILSHLFQRSCISSLKSGATSNFFRRSNCALVNAQSGRDLHRYVNAGINWNISPTVELSSASENSEVCAMAFDSEGVLLATGDDHGSIHVYDFDDVYAMDLKKRNEISRRLWEVEKSDKGREKLRKNESSEVGCNNNHQQGDVEKDEVDQVGEGEPKRILRMTTCSIPSISPSTIRPLLSFTCGGRGGKFRISELQWNPNNQDQLVVSFANKQEIHIYDAACSQSPLPCLKLTGVGKGGHTEGISSFRFVPQSPALLKTSSSTNILTGGTYGSIHLWSMPKTRQKPLSNLNAKCLWSISVFSRREEGVGDMTILPCSSKQPDTPCSNNQTQRPLVLIGGNASSLVLLDANKCNRKAFSTKITPTILSCWDLSSMASHELAGIDPGGILPARRWMGVQKMSLMNCGYINNISRYRVSVVVKCGWIFALEIKVDFSPRISNPSSPKPTISVRLSLLHKTSRIQCFNSSNERITSLGGMALQYSLPEIPIPSITPCNTNRNMIWVGDVKMRTYTMPSKDKFTLSNTDFSVIKPQSSLPHRKESSTDHPLREPGGGLILVTLSSSLKSRTLNESLTSVDEETSLIKSNDEHHNDCIVARLPLYHGTPLSMAIHPSGEWMVVGYGMNGRGLSSRSLELISFRKTIT